MDVLNKVYHKKPSIKSVLCNRKKTSNNFGPHTLRNIVKTDFAFKEIFNEINSKP